MRVIARPMGTGKTKELLDLAAENNGTVLTTNKRALIKKAKDYGLSSLTIIDVNDLFYGDFNIKKPLYIHKVGDVIAEIINRDFGPLTLAGYSVTLEGE